MMDISKILERSTDCKRENYASGDGCDQREYSCNQCKQLGSRCSTGRETARDEARTAKDDLARPINRTSKETGTAILKLSTETQSSFKAIGTLSPPPRRIRPEHRPEIIRFLSTKPSKVRIEAIASDVEAYRFAQDWYEVLKLLLSLNKNRPAESGHGARIHPSGSQTICDGSENSNLLVPRLRIPSRCSFLLYSERCQGGFSENKVAAALCENVRTKTFLLRTDYLK